MSNTLRRPLSAHRRVDDADISLAEIKIVSLRCGPIGRVENNPYDYIGFLWKPARPHTTLDRFVAYTLASAN